jgi:hypothetical protein
MYVDREAVALDGFSRPHEPSPNIFACLGVRTHGLKNRSVVFHRNPLKLLKEYEMRISRGMPRARKKVDATRNLKQKLVKRP